MSRHIDLYRDLRKPVPRGPRPQVLMPALLVAALVWAGFEAVQAQRQLSRSHAELALLQRSTETLQQMLAQATPASTALDDAKQVAALEKLAAQLQADVGTAHEGFVPTLTALARARTDGVWLTAIELDATRPRVALHGKATDATRVPALLQALAREPTFAGAAFGQLELKPAADAGKGSTPEGAVQFRVAAVEVAGK